MKGPARVAFETLGCKVNQYDTQALSELFAGAGFRVVEPGEPADVYVVNTCAVTAVAERKSRQAVRRAVRRAAGRGAVLVTGCLAQLRGDALARLPGVAAVVGPENRRTLLELAARWVKGAGRPPAAWPEGGWRGRPPRARRPVAYEELPVSSFGARCRAVVKVQDGCDEMCTFCAVPYARGMSRSRAPEAVLDEVRRLVDAGYREVVLSGVHLGAYGRDLGGGTDLARLVERIEGLDGVFRVRLSSLLPTALTDGLVAVWRGSRRLCPHLHLSLQSGDDGVLSAMGRRYTADEVRRRLDRLREAVPDLAVSCDVIVGFPGETERAFQATVRLLEELPVVRLHRFPFSPRPATAAARLGPGPAPPAVRRRMTALRELEDRLALEFHRTLEGRDVEVLVEHPRAGAVRPEGVDGHYVRVELEALGPGAPAPGTLVGARVTRAGPRKVRAVVRPAGRREAGER